MGNQRVSFKRYVEVGRVVLVSNDESKNNLATIVEIVDQNRVCILGLSQSKARTAFRER